MTEEEARRWIGAAFGDDALDRLSRLAELVHDEVAHQNLVAPATLPQMWSRHIADSAQLVALAPAQGSWLDIGTGAGFPGLVVAALRVERTILVEPRKLRADFLRRAAGALGLTHVVVRVAKVEAIAEPSTIISARAVAPVEKLLHAAAHCATIATRWLMPRGRSGAAELAALRRGWTGEFHVKQSVTDSDSVVLVLEHVARRGGR